MSRRDWIEVGVSLLSGAGIGAGLMYLFDPELGDRRRARATQRAGDYASAAGERIGAGWDVVADRAQGVADRARSFAGSLSDAASSRAKYLSKRSRRLGSSLADQASGFWSRGASRASDLVDDASDRGRGLVRRALGYREGPSTGGIAGITAGALGALALGAGLMYLLDPTHGQRRRAMIRDRAYGAAQTAADYGHHLADRAGDVAHSAGRYASSAYSSAKGAVGMGQGRMVDDQTLTDRVRTAIQHLGNTSGVQCRVENGRVTLSGSMPAGGMDSLVSAVRGVTGVSDVDNQLAVRDSYSSI